MGFDQDSKVFIVNPAKLEHGVWRINAGIPFALP